MERRRLGASDVEVSRVILGCGNFGGIGSAPEFFGQGESEEEAFRLMDAAWEVGITTFDTADAYGGGRSETMIGKWISARGRQPQIVTKTFNPMATGQDHGLSRARIARQIETSLDRLGVSRVDVYLAHEFDPDIPLQETLETFESLVATGLIKTWGVSNFNGAQLRAALDVARPSVVQNSYSLLDRGDEEDVLPLCNEFGIAYTPFGPLAGGLLTGKYRLTEGAPAGSRLATRPEPYEQFLTEETFARIQAFGDEARARGVSTATLALAWLFAQPQVTAVVVGPRRVEHLEPALEALDLHLTKADAGQLAALF